MNSWGLSQTVLRLALGFELVLPNFSSLFWVATGGRERVYYCVPSLFLCTHFFIHVLFDYMYLCISFCAILRFFNRLFRGYPQLACIWNNCALSILFCVNFVCMCVYSCVPNTFFRPIFLRKMLVRYNYPYVHY